MKALGKARDFNKLEKLSESLQAFENKRGRQPGDEILIKLTGRYRIEKGWPENDSGFYCKILQGSRQGQYSAISDDICPLATNRQKKVGELLSVPAEWFEF